MKRGTRSARRRKIKQQVLARFPYFLSFCAKDMTCGSPPKPRGAVPAEEAEVVEAAEALETAEAGEAAEALEAAKTGKVERG